MGLKITNEVYTNKGLTNEMYVNIQRININKQLKNSVSINKYLNKLAKDDNENNLCSCFDIPNIFILDLDIESLETNYVYELVYTKIKQTLISKGFNIEDLQ